MSEILIGGIPHVTADDEVTTLLADLADDLLVLAKKCIKQTPNGLPGQCFTWLEQPGTLCCDYLSVSPHTIRPIAQSPDNPGSAFPQENFQNLKDCTSFYWVPRFDIHLARQCAPIYKEGHTGRITDANPHDRSKWARDIMIDMQVLSCCILDSLLDGYKVGGKTWRLEELFPQQVKVDQFGPCTIMEFKLMFDTPDYCCFPDGTMRNGSNYELVRNDNA